MRANTEAFELKRLRRHTSEVEALNATAAAVADAAKVKAAAHKKQATLLDRFQHVSGAWAERVAAELQQLDGVLDAVAKLQRAGRSQARCTLCCELFRQVCECARARDVVSATTVSSLESRVVGRSAGTGGACSSIRHGAPQPRTPRLRRARRRRLL